MGPPLIPRRGQCQSYAPCDSPCCAKARSLGCVATKRPGDAPKHGGFAIAVAIFFRNPIWDEKVLHFTPVFCHVFCHVDVITCLKPVERAVSALSSIQLSLLLGDLGMADGCKGHSDHSDHHKVATATAATASFLLGLVQGVWILDV